MTKEESIEKVSGPTRKPMILIREEEYKKAYGSSDTSKLYLFINKKNSEVHDEFLIFKNRAEKLFETTNELGNCIDDLVNSDYSKLETFTKTNAFRDFGEHSRSVIEELMKHEYAKRLELIEDISIFFSHINQRIKDELK